MLPKSGASAYLVTLNRPDRLNCFNFQVCHQLSNIFSTLLREDSCDLVIFTGAGKNFCAGADLSNPPNPLEASSDLPQNLVDNPIHQMSLLQVPIIGAIQGHVSINETNLWIVDVLKLCISINVAKLVPYNSNAPYLSKRLINFCYASLNCLYLELHNLIY
jgi:hypothetical protein